MSEDNSLGQKLQNPMSGSLGNFYNNQGLSQTLNLEDHHDNRLTKDMGVEKISSGPREKAPPQSQNFNTGENIYEQKKQRTDGIMMKSQIGVSSTKPQPMNLFPKAGPSASKRFGPPRVKHDSDEDGKNQEENKYAEDPRKMIASDFNINSIPQNPGLENKVGVPVVGMIVPPFVSCAPNPMQPRFKPNTYEDERKAVVVEEENNNIVGEKGLDMREKGSEFMDIVFSIEHLSEVKDLIVPVVLNQDSSPNPTLYNFAVESFPNCNFHASQLSSDHITSLFPHNQKLISSLIPHLSCSCGTSLSQKLTCGHISCLPCCGSDINSLSCPICKTSIPCYSFSLKAYPCLSCKQIKTQRTSCIHYCYTCLNRKILRKGSFNCVLCPKFFEFNAFYEENVLIMNCKICQNECKDIFETCDGCFYCRECFKKTLKDRKCGVCEREIGKKEFSRLRKMLKFVCQNCFTLKDWENVIVQECCRGKVCKKCMEKVTKCLLCQ